MMVASQLDPAKAVYRAVIPAGEPWIHGLDVARSLREGAQELLRRLGAQGRPSSAGWYLRLELVVRRAACC